MKVKSFTAILLVILCSIPLANAADQSMFNYQGRVLVQGFPYTGTGRMKAAILATSGTDTVISLWSNDGTSSAGSEPTNSFDVSVTSGVFDAMIGDSNEGMATIPAILFNRDDELKIRVWFNDGIHGYQQLTPDRRITNPRRLGLSRITAPTWLYVNATSGNDLNDGLTTNTAKKTVNAVVSMLPRSIYADTTIKLAAGTYAPFSINGFGDMGASLYVIGDSVHDPYLSETLSVIVDGTGAGSGVVVSNCMSVHIAGIQVQSSYYGFFAADQCSHLYIDRCRAINCDNTAFRVDNGSWVFESHCVAENSGAGFSVIDNSHDTISSCIAKSCGNGLAVYYNSSASLTLLSLISNSTGVLSRYNCAMASGSQITYSGNSTNTNVASGSSIY